MQGTIAQTLALAMHGNAHLRGFSVGRFFPDNSTCSFCKFVGFVRLSSRGQHEIPFADTPDDWFHKLKSDGFERLVSSGWLFGTSLYAILGLRTEGQSLSSEVVVIGALRRFGAGQVVSGRRDGSLVIKTIRSSESGT